MVPLVEVSSPMGGWSCLLSSYRSIALWQSYPAWGPEVVKAGMHRRWVFRKCQPIWFSYSYWPLLWPCGAACWGEGWEAMSTACAWDLNVRVMPN